MSVLTKTNITELRRRGFEIQNGSYDLRIAMNTIAMAWLLNHIYSQSKLGVPLTLGLLKEVASTKIADWIEMRIKLIPIEVNDSITHQLIFYLNGTPPRAFLSYPPSSRGFSSPYELTLNDCAPFKLGNNTIAHVLFTEQQQSALLSGELLLENRVN